MERQQNVANRKIALLVLSAISNQIEDLKPLIPAALIASGTSSRDKYFGSEDEPPTAFVFPTASIR